MRFWTLTTSQSPIGQPFMSGLTTCSVPDAAVSPQNLMDAGQFEVKTPDATIKVSPDRRDLIETRQIGGTPYVLIRIEGPIEVNGVTIQPDAPDSSSH